MTAETWMLILSTAVTVVLMIRDVARDLRDR
jgi:hypothetical protein